MLQWLCEQMMEAEVTAKIQAQKSERTDTGLAIVPAIVYIALTLGWAPCIPLFPNCAKAVMCPFLSRRNHGLKQP